MLDGAASGRRRNADSNGVSCQVIGRAQSVEIAGENWLIVGLMSGAAIAMAMTLLILNLIVGPSKPSKAKSDPYESGVPGVAPVKARFTPRFYMVAMLFVVFDIEAVFIYPWAVSFDALGRYGFVAMMVFILLLLEGYVYAWKKGALEWV
jgi:NADH-quinone oxidoreductase subunit A